MLMHCWRYSSGKSCIPKLHTWLTPWKQNFKQFLLTALSMGLKVLTVSYLSGMYSQIWLFCVTAVFMLSIYLLTENSACWDGCRRERLCYMITNKILITPKNEVFQSKDSFIEVKKFYATQSFAISSRLYKWKYQVGVYSNQIWTRSHLHNAHVLLCIHIRGEK